MIYSRRHLPDDRDLISLSAGLAAPRLIRFPRHAIINNASQVFDTTWVFWQYDGQATNQNQPAILSSWWNIWDLGGESDEGIKKCPHAILMGIQTGSAVYLILLAFSIQKHPPWQVISSVSWWWAVLIEVVQFNFKNSEDRFPFLVSILHCISPLSQS